MSFTISIELLPINESREFSAVLQLYKEIIVGQNSHLCYGSVPSNVLRSECHYSEIMIYCLNKIKYQFGTISIDVRNCFTFTVGVFSPL